MGPVKIFFFSDLSFFGLWQLSYIINFVIWHNAVTTRTNMLIYNRILFYKLEYFFQLTPRAILLCFPFAGEHICWTLMRAGAGTQQKKKKPQPGKMHRKNYVGRAHCTAGICRVFPCRDGDVWHKKFSFTTLCWLGKFSWLLGLGQLGRLFSRV